MLPNTSELNQYLDVTSRRLWVIKWGGGTMLGFIIAISSPFLFQVVLDYELGRMLFIFWIGSSFVCVLYDPCQNAWTEFKDVLWLSHVLYFIHFFFEKQFVLQSALPHCHMYIPWNIKCLSYIRQNRKSLCCPQT